MKQEIFSKLKTKAQLDERFDHCDQLKVPSSAILEQLLVQLKEVLFQGFLSNKNNDEYYQVYQQSLASLEQEIRIALSFYNSTGYDGCDDSYAAHVASHIIEAFEATLPSIQESLLKDVEVTFKGDPAANSYDEIIMFYPGLHATFSYRIANLLHKLNVPYLPKMIMKLAHEKTAIDIHPAATIAAGLMIDHGVGVVIGSTCVIGSNVSIYQGVTLGALSTKNRELIKDIKRHPTIEDDVTIYANATILGGDTVIGQGSTIGGNVFLTSSVDKQTTVILKKQDFLFKQK